MADVSVRALLLDLMMRLKTEFDLTYLFITYDLATAKYVCDTLPLCICKFCEVIH
jgi:peptide/nickel transport system ATP-binding protein